MVNGVTILRLGGVTYYSPAFPRGGLGAVLVWEVLALSAAALDVDVQHKNVDDVSWSSLTSTAFGAGIGFLGVTGLKEQIRIGYVAHGANDTDAVTFQMFPPLWRPY